MDFEVRIERLVLDGLDLEPGGADVLAAALQTELSRRLLAAATAAGERGRPAGPKGRAPDNAIRLVLPHVTAAGAGPELLGRRIGASLAGGLNHG